LTEESLSLALGIGKLRGKDGTFRRAESLTSTFKPGTMRPEIMKLALINER